MGFNRFTVNIIIRSGLIGLNALIIAFMIARPEWIFTFIFLCLIFVLQIYFLIRYATKINRDLAHFLIHLKEQDTTLAFSRKNLDNTFNGLTKQFESINIEFRKIKDKEIRRQNFLNLMLKQVGTGILVINQNNDLILYNKAILNLFDLTEHAANQEILNRIFSSLNELQEINPGDQKIESIHISGITRRILITSSEIKEDQETQKIFSFHDIDREMTDYELQSWNGLIKVLSHEIMNTITPLSTVTDTLNDCLTENEIEKSIDQLNEKDITDSVKSIKLIENRISGLKNFISRFRQFSDIPLPEPQEIQTVPFLENITQLYKSKHPEINFIIDPANSSHSIYADKTLLELVINNVIKNAIEALSETDRPNIIFRANKDANSNFIEIQNNGQEIEANVLKKVFLPFFTTKKDGSGIGLSLARQIMFSHKGNIEIFSNKEGTTVRLIFNKQ